MNRDGAIAIIGLAGRFPGAPSVDHFWRNIRDGVESITRFSEDELRASGVATSVYAHPDYVPARAILEGIDLFDAGFFGYSPRDAELLDPQQRLFLECAWEALEQAAYDPFRYNGAIGVYAGMSPNTYLANNLRSRRRATVSEFFELYTGNAGDFLTTRVSYKLNLRGPSLDIQTACSTSLVSVVVACQSLLSYQCDIALAGGVSITVPQRTGYLYQPGMIVSPDGHCRAFDARARGTVGSEGVGVVVLKRLTEALADGDYIHAVILGSAINNDGALKVGFTAPSVEGQAEVITLAHAVAGVKPDSIDYVEAHGTGTELGDPIEIAGLTRAFGGQIARRSLCALGSVKTNIGHADAAAGVAGLIKSVMALVHREIPPSLHYETPNPELGLDRSPFFVNTSLRSWSPGPNPRRAGVSSFGIGGTNAHVVLEEAPPREAGSASRPWQVLTLSARSPEALDRATERLREHLDGHPELDLGDVAYTLQVGRRAFEHRRATVVRDRIHALQALGSVDPQVLRGGTAAERPMVVFLFPGQGAQHVGMLHGLYTTEPLFRDELDACTEALRPHLGLDLRDVLYPPDGRTHDAARMLAQTAIAQPVLFAVEYALAQLWLSWGITPAALLGHSLGEYVAACLAGVWSREDGLGLVAARGRLMQAVPAGAMLAVSLPSEEVQPLLGDACAVAAINGPALCVASGPPEGIEVLAAGLTARGVVTRRLQTSHAFHSPMMDPVVEALRAEVAKVALRAPTIPFLSNVTGTWITPSEATDPGYWARQVRQSVQFASGLMELRRTPDRVLLEVGPGRTLTTLARQHDGGGSERVVMAASARHPHDPQADAAALLSAVGTLWTAGVDIAWTALHGGAGRQRVPLPTYPFERRRYWVDAEPVSPGHRDHATSARKRSDITEWFYLPSWVRSLSPPPVRAGDIAAAPPVRWLVLGSPDALTTALVRRLRQEQQEVVTVETGSRLERRGADEWVIAPYDRAHYQAVVDALIPADRRAVRIVHLWNLGEPTTGERADAFDVAQTTGYYSLLFLAQALAARQPIADVRIVVLASGLHDVTGYETLYPERATMLGLCQVIPQEFRNIRCQAIDVVAPGEDHAEAAVVGDLVLAELVVETDDVAVAYRAGRRLVQTFEPAPLSSSAKLVRSLRPGGTYLITGGLGRVGLLLAEYLARTFQARLVLVGRSPMPDREAWGSWLEAHGEDDATSQKIRRVLELETLGAEVFVTAADVADVDQMRAVLGQVDRRFGTLHGVLHGAAAMSDQGLFGPIPDLGLEESEAHYRPKVRGAYALEKILRGRSLDFCLLFSSNASVLGGLGFGAYSAANHFLDMFAVEQSRTSGFPWISATWDVWLTEDPDVDAVRRSSMEEYSMRPAESIEAFRRVVSLAPGGRIVVSTGDLAARLDLWIRGKTDDERVGETESGSAHVRPGLATAYAGPSSDIERGLAEIWQALLRIDRVGVHDNFFELNGHSLLGTQLMSRVREAFQVDLPLRALFEGPTVAELGAAIIRLQADQEATDRAEVQRMIEGLSDDEIERELARRAEESSDGRA